MKRRSMISVAGGVTLAVALPVRAQTPPKVYRIGVLTRGLPRAYFLLPAALAALGYEEGRNILFDYRSAEGQPERVPALAADLVAQNVDLIVAISNTEVAAAKRATSTIPILMMYGAVPVEVGLIASFARPGANVTGTTVHGPETAAKMLQLLRDTVPPLKRVAVLLDRDNPGLQPYIRASEKAAVAMGIQMPLLDTRTVADLEAALARIVRERPDALYVVMGGTNFEHSAQIIEFAARQRLPAIYTDKSSIADGRLMSYAYNGDDLVKRAAAIADRILKGAKPADIPVEQPTKMDFAINLKTAKAMGLTIPQSVRLQATEVIE